MSISSSLTESSSMESHKSDSSQNYITVIPVEYPRSRVYSQTPEYLVDQYSEYLRDRSRDEYLRGDYNINADAQFDDVGPLYTVSQRFDRESKPHITGSTYGSLSHDVEREKSHLVSSGYSSAVHDIDREREKPHIIPNTYGSLSHDLDRDREKSHILTNSYSSSNHDIERDKHLITNSYGSLSHDIDRDRDMKPHLAANNFSSMSHDLDREREWERPHHTHIAATSEVNQSSTKEGSLSKDGPHEEQKSVQVSLIQSLKICVYLMSRVVLQMELEDGAATTVHDLIQAILQEEELGLPRVAANIFSLWMCSGLLGEIIFFYYNCYYTIEDLITNTSLDKLYIFQESEETF